MKKIWILILLLLLTIPVESFASDRLITISVDWQLSVRGGFENRFHPHLGLKADIGASFYGTIVADAFFILYMLPKDCRLQVNILAGIPNVSILLSFNAAMVSFGASLLARYNFTDSVSMDIRLGEGFPLFFESGNEIIRDIHFPLDLWPDVTLGLNFKI